MDKPPTFKGIPLEYVSGLDESCIYPTGDARDGCKTPRYYHLDAERAKDAEAWLRALAGEDIDPWDEEHREATERALRPKKELEQ